MPGARRTSTRAPLAVPPGRNYMITGAAVSAARVQLAALSEQYRPPGLGRLRPQGSTA